MDPGLRTYALRELKQGKAARIDNITVELLKNVGKNTEHKLFEMIEKIYRDGNIPKNFAKFNTTFFHMFYLHFQHGIYWSGPITKSLN
jgi:hypothetical protein